MTQIAVRVNNPASRKVEKFSTLPVVMGHIRLAGCDSHGKQRHEGRNQVQARVSGFGQMPRLPVNRPTMSCMPANPTAASTDKRAIIVLSR
jgi:hypothetical protein